MLYSPDLGRSSWAALFRHSYKAPSANDVPLARGGAEPGRATKGAPRAHSNGTASRPVLSDGVKERRTLRTFGRDHQSRGCASAHRNQHDIGPLCCGLSPETWAAPSSSGPFLWRFRNPESASSDHIDKLTSLLSCRCCRVLSRTSRYLTNSYDCSRRFRAGAAPKTGHSLANMGK